MKFDLTYENYNRIRDKATNVKDYNLIYNLMWHTYQNCDYQDMIRIILDFECTRLRLKYYNKYKLRGNNPPLLGVVYDDVQEMILTMYSVFSIEETDSIDLFVIGFIDTLFCNGRMFDNINNLEEEVSDRLYYRDEYPDYMFKDCRIYEENDIAVFIHDYLKYLYESNPLVGRDELIIFDEAVYGLDDDTYYFLHLKGEILEYVYKF